MKIAIVGATGAVGREMIKDLEASRLRDIDVRLCASPRSAGTLLSFRNRNVEVEAFDAAALKGVDYVLMSAGGGFSRDHSPLLVKQGATVIDNSSAFRMVDDVALVVPEVNAAELKKKKGPQIIANPNCSTIQLVVALKPLADKFGLEMVSASTYQSVSGTGQQGIAELGQQVEAQFRFQDPVVKVYAQPIAFNLLPSNGNFDAGGHTEEETKMVRETRKIMNLPDLFVTATSVRVPTFNCHGETVMVRLKRPVTRAEALEAFKGAAGLVLNDKDTHESQPTPKAAAGDGRVYVSRVRLPYGEAKSPWLQFWNVADNLKKGAATNAVQILEALAATH
jgi:aspartate-semialdehyde dehydrogenase